MESGGVREITNGVPENRLKSKHFSLKIADAELFDKLVEIKSRLSQ